MLLLTLKSIKNREEREWVTRSNPATCTEMTTSENKTWRGLKHIVYSKTKNLIKSLPAKERNDPARIIETITNYLLEFEMASDKKTFNTLLS